MRSINKKTEITNSLRELTATYVANLNQCELVLEKLSRQLELEEPVSLRDALQNNSSGPMGRLIQCDRPQVDASIFCITYRGHHCDLGNTLPFWLFVELARQLNRYVSYERLLADVWHFQKRSNEAIRNVVQILKKKLIRAGLNDLAAAIDGRNRGHYGLILDRHI